MGTGIRMRRLWRLRAGVTSCLVVALLVAVWSVEKISLSPPGLSPRSLEMASASTHVVIDTPKSALLDNRQDTSGLEGLTERAVLLGNVISSGEVRAQIAREANVPPEILQIDAPLTRAQPRPLAQSGNEKHTSDILRSTDQYRLSILANPTVPVLDIYAQTPTAASAEALANAAVDSLRGYLRRLAVSEQTPETQQIRLVQLGRAEGAVINRGIRWQVALLAFALTFATACATLVFLARVREGWQVEADSEPPRQRREEPLPQEQLPLAR
jgi:hypothetical protein